MSYKVITKDDNPLTKVWVIDIPLHVHMGREEMPGTLLARDLQINQRIGKFDSSVTFDIDSRNLEAKVTVTVPKIEEWTAIEAIIEKSIAEHFRDDGLQPGAVSIMPTADAAA